VQVGAAVRLQTWIWKAFDGCPKTVPRYFVRGGGSTNSVEDRENGDLGGGAAAP